MKNLMCLLLVAFLTTTTFAQRKGMAKKAEATVERMTTELDLTPEQQEKIKALYEARTAERGNSSALTKEEYKVSRAEFGEQIDAILTPEQIEKRNALKEEHLATMKEKRKANGLNKRGGKKGNKLGQMTPEMIENRAVKSTERLDKQVGLTEAQQSSVKTAYLNFYQKNQGIAADSSMDAAAKKEMLTQLKKEHKEELSSLLTEEQLAARKANKKLKKASRKENK